MKITINKKAINNLDSKNKQNFQDYNPENEINIYDTKRAEEELKTRNYENSILEQEIEALKNDIELKKSIKNIITNIVWVVIIFSILIIVCDSIYFMCKDKHIYSEYFLGVVLGSQLLILPLALLSIVTKHLFPPKK